MRTTENTKTYLRRTRRRARISRGRRLAHHARACRARRSNVNGGRKCTTKLSDKLEALKNLIPAHNGEIVKADQLFQETADYIVLLRTQVVILKRLIDFYGSSERDNVVVS